MNSEMTSDELPLTTLIVPKSMTNDVTMPVIGWYGVDHEGYETVNAKERNVLNMFDAGTVTAEALVKQSAAQAALAVKDAEIAKLRNERDMWASEHELQIDAKRELAEELAALTAERDVLRKDALRLRNILLEIKEHGLSWDDSYDAAMTKEAEK